MFALRPLFFGRQDNFSGSAREFNNVKAHNGKKVAINGFMMPIDQNAEGSREFALNGNFDMCGFGGPISINQWIVVK